MMKRIKRYTASDCIQQISIILFFFITVSILTGCVGQQSQVKLPQDIPATWNFADKSEAPVISVRILDLLNDPRVTALAEEALGSNPDLGAASDRLLAKASLLGVSGSRLWPEINLDLSSNRGNQTLNSVGENSSESLHRVGVGISWELDLWGRIRDEHNANHTSFKIQHWEYSAARDSLISRTIQSWVRAVSLARSIEISRERIGNLVKIQERILSRYRDGIGSIDELSTANTRIYSAKADMSELVEEHAQSVRALELLLGRYPENLLIPGGQYPELRLPAILKPGEVLVNRPDVHIAMDQVRVAELQQSAAEKSYLPSLLVTGKLFKEDVRLSDITSGTLLWDMILAASQPVFNAGRIRSEIEARKWEHGAAVMELKSVVLRATGEVKKYWGLEQMLKKKEALLQLAVLEATKSYSYFEKRYLDGLDPIVNMLNAKEEQLTIQGQINELQAAKLINRIDLALALGLGENDER